jgi:hypothetical protein
MVSRNPGHSTPQLQHIHQQNAEKEQQRNGPEQEPHEVRLTATAVSLTARAKSAASYSTNAHRS